MTVQGYHSGCIQRSFVHGFCEEAFCESGNMKTQANNNNLISLENRAVVTNHQSKTISRVVFSYMNNEQPISFKLTQEPPYIVVVRKPVAVQGMNVNSESKRFSQITKKLFKICTETKTTDDSQLILTIRSRSLIHKTENIFRFN